MVLLCRKHDKQSRYLLVIYDLDVLDMTDAAEVVEDELLRGAWREVEDAQAARHIRVQTF